MKKESRLMRRLLFVALLLLFASVPLSVYADDDPSTFWTVETRCIAEPTEPLDGWTYTGTLLMTGYEGIYALNTDSESLDLLVSISAENTEFVPLRGGQLSPDGSWYAVPVGEPDTQTAINYFFPATGVRVYSLVDDHVLDFDLSDTASIETEWAYSIVTWLDNDSFVVGDTLFYPFEDRTEAAPFYSGDFSYSDFFVSPDLTRIYSYDSDVISLPDTIQAIGEFPSSAVGYGAAWRHDSAGFIAPFGSDADGDILQFSTRDGDETEAIFDIQKGGVNFGISTSSMLGSFWSPDDQYFAFVRFSPDFRQSSLHVIDWTAQTVIDTCLPAYSNPVWSSDGTMLVYFAAPVGESLSVNIIDIAEWRAYQVGEHVVSRYTASNEAPRMLGWHGE